MEKAYEAYKDSGLNYLGNIPAHWKIVKLKYIGDAITGITYSPNDVVPDDNGLLVLRSSNIQNGKLSLSNNVFVDKEIKEKYLTRLNDILLCSRNGSRNLIGKNIIIDEQVENQTWGAFMTVYRTQHSKFAYYFFNSPIFDALSSLFLSSTINQLTIGVINNFILALPPKQEQAQIAAYLDFQTNKIDAVINKKETLIQKLQEQRQATINKAVTKGLNEKVELKDSGIEWLGEIPKHWVIPKLKFLTRQIIDGAHFTPTYVKEGVPFLRVTDIQTEKINLDKVKFIPESEHLNLIKRCNPEKGDILLSKNGTIGITKVIDWDWEFSIFVSLCLIKFNKKLTPRYFSHFFNSSIVDQQIKMSSKTTSVTNLHLEKIKELLIAIPTSTDEQISISDYLDERLKEFDNVISVTNNSIQKLKDYRQSLISEAVTGKIDVSNWCKPNN